VGVAVGAGAAPPVAVPIGTVDVATGDGSPGAPPESTIASVVTEPWLRAKASQATMKAKSATLMTATFILSCRSRPSPAHLRLITPPVPAITAKMA